MPFISGQTSGLIAGVVMTMLFVGIYLIMKFTGNVREGKEVNGFDHKRYKARFSEEISDELSEADKKRNKLL
jgi:hypothetical protein